MLLGEEVVKLPMEGMDGRHHYLYFHRYFTSVSQGLGVGVGV